MFGVQVTTHPKQSFGDSAVCRSRMSVCKRLSDLVLCAGWNIVKQMNTMEYDEKWRSMKKYEDMSQKIYISQNSPQNRCLFNRRALNSFKALKVTDMRATLYDAIFLLMLQFPRHQISKSAWFWGAYKDGDCLKSPITPQYSVPGSWTPTQDSISTSSPVFENFFQCLQEFLETLKKAHGFVVKGWKFVKVWQIFFIQEISGNFVENDGDPRFCSSHRQAGWTV